ncbi:3-carboxy-cis,cis-muconate cycloisomerase [Salinifilum ghardaiensis]
MDSLFGAMFSTPRATEQTGARAWLAAMLEFESALAGAEADAGLVPADAAAEIDRCCRVDAFDPESIAERAVSSATPVIALVRDLTEQVDTSTARHVHKGATSQDVVDTAAMLVAARTTDLVLADLRGAAAACAQLAERHRDTPMVGRSLLQQALPTTFGARCATWLTSLEEAAAALRRVRRERLAVQLGGAAGTLASLDGQGPAVVAGLAERLGLTAPAVPWHTDRTRIAELAGALGTVTGVCGKIARDVSLHAQTEVGELTEGRSGGSSAMPHKQNPVGSVLVGAIARRVPDLVSTVLGAMPQEYERAAGAWQAEWEPVTQLLRLTAAAAAHTRAVLAELRVHPQRMAANLGATGGAIMAEAAAAALSEHLDRTEAHELVGEASRRAAEHGGTLAAQLRADERVRAVLSESAIDAATDPAGHLGHAPEFVDTALHRHAHLEEQ